MSTDSLLTSNWASRHSTPTITCPSCHALRPRCIGPIPPSFSFAGTVLGEPLPGGSLFACLDCGLGFRHPQLPEEELASFYRSAGAETWLADAPRPDWHIAQQWLHKDRSRGAVLDVGCFDGGFLRSLGGAYELYGVELNDKAAHTAALSGIQIVARDFCTDLTEVEHRFDAVCAFDVIEHVHNPLRFVRQLVHLCSPNGLIIIASGNLHAPSWQFMGSRYWYCAMAEHLSFISPAWCRWVARKLEITFHRSLTFSHLGKSSAAGRSLELVKNIVYKTCPRICGRLRRHGVGAIDVSQHSELGLYPPTFASARDHFIALFSRG